MDFSNFFFKWSELLYFVSIWSAWENLRCEHIQKISYSVRKMLLGRCCNICNGGSCMGRLHHKTVLVLISAFLSKCLILWSFYQLRQYEDGRSALKSIGFVMEGKLLHKHHLKSSNVPPDTSETALFSRVRCSGIYKNVMLFFLSAIAGSTVK